jgi:hypothetical protein
MLVTRGGPTMLARIGRHESLEPERRAPVHVAQRSSLGAAQAGARPLILRIRELEFPRYDAGKKGTPLERVHIVRSQ